MHLSSSVSGWQSVNQVVEQVHPHARTRIATASLRAVLDLMRTSLAPVLWGCQ